MTAASRGSSSFHGMAKEGSYAVWIWRSRAPSLEKVFDLDFTSSEFLDVPIEIRRAVRLQPIQGSGEPAFESGADRCKLSLDGGFGKLVRGDAERFCSPLEATEGFFVPEVERESGVTHAISIARQASAQRHQIRPLALNRSRRGEDFAAECSWSLLRRLRSISWSSSSW